MFDTRLARRELGLGGVVFTLGVDYSAAASVLGQYGSAALHRGARRNFVAPTFAILVIRVDHPSAPNHIAGRTKTETMAVQINIAEAKAKLSSLLDRAIAGEEIVIARAGKPLARLVPVGERVQRKPGLLRDWKIPSDVFLETMDPEDLDAAEGKYTDEFGISLSHSDKP